MKKKMQVVWHIIKELWKVNWTKTIYFNFKKFPFNVAKKLPVFFYGKITFTDISGKIQINHEIKTGMIAFGKPYEKAKCSKNIAELNMQGTFILNGFVHFGKDCLLIIERNAVLKMGNMSSLGSDGKIICTKEITLSDYARIGSESRLVDTNSHTMMDTKTGVKLDVNQSIFLGKYNYVASLVSIMPGARTPDYCTVAIHSLLNKDYTSCGENILIGGIPAKLLRQNTSRDWEGESKLFENLKKFY